jgi:hypothetical protein
MAHYDPTIKIAVMEADIKRLFGDVARETDFRNKAIGQITVQLETLQKLLTEQDREFRGVINRVLGALVVLQIVVPIALQFIFKS